MYDSIKAWTCKLGRIEKLYAFTYQPQRPEKDVNGWLVYDARREWKRLGISEKGADKGWRISTVNKDYGVGGPNQRPRNNCLPGLVLPYIPSVATCTFSHLRQHPQLCGQISFARTPTSPNILTPGQQLLDHPMRTAISGDQGEP